MIPLFVAAALIAAALLLAVVLWLTGDRTDRELRRLIRLHNRAALAAQQDDDLSCPPDCPGQHDHHPET